MITFFGIHIHEFSIALSDLILSIESSIIAYLLYKNTVKNNKGDALHKLAMTLFILLSLSSFVGALFHAFFPGKAESPDGFIVWMITTALIGLIAATTLYINSYFFKNKYISKALHVIVVLFLIAYFYTIFFVDYHFPTVIKFYAPPIVILAGIAYWKLFTEKKSVWVFLCVGITLSIVAPIVQALRINIDPVYLNFNTLYHLIQGIALILLYSFFKRYTV